MTMPVFPPGEDPGASFADLLRRIGASAADLDGEAAALGAIPHATTCVAMRYADGVVMAGDRRATAGNLISHRAMDKVVEADRHSGVAIAGAAGPATEMVRLFQLQLEHYEKVEGIALSLEGKANQLSMMVRGNLQAAMMGLAVVPIFAGFDLRRGVGRLFDYDVTGGRYEEREYVATGSGSLHAGTVIKIGYRPGLDRSAARRPRLPGALGGGRRRLGDRRSGHPPGDLPHGGHDHRRRLRAGRRRRVGPTLRGDRSPRCANGRRRTS